MKTVLLNHMLLHQKPCFLVIAALYRKPFHTFREPLEPFFGKWFIGCSSSRRRWTED